MSQAHVIQHPGANNILGVSNSLRRGNGAVSTRFWRCGLRKTDLMLGSTYALDRFVLAYAL